ncbi:MAG: Txe/YoeB family addiction module toxin [Quinella sp. 1Q7]|nr:Txe/YoeB family addiction module toxin [Quinella sp. 1Q7]
MNKRWDDDAWEDYVAWQFENKKTLKRINTLIKDIERNGAMTGIGKPERLKYEGGYSRRIDDTNRLIYDIDDQGYLYIKSCKGHYK